MHETHSFGYWLRRRRKALDLTQTELADRVGCSVVTIRRIEADERRPSKQMAECLADELAVALEERAAFLKAARAELAADRLAVAAQPVNQATLPTPPSEQGQAAVPRHNLPAQLSSFVGREREITELTHLLTMTRLLTLTGAGGSGKTRLALEVAADLVGAYCDGVWLVELAPLSDPALVPQTVATALGVVAHPQRALIDVLLDHLRTKQLLLLLDNCEHLIQAAAHLTKTLLSACPQLQILATSRELLHLTGEVSWLVPPLSFPAPQQLPPVEALSQYEAVQLFVERARARQPAFAVTAQNAQAVVEICRRLEGIPLAIELAATRIGMLSAGQIATRLADALRLLTDGDRTGETRQHTLRGTLDWSYQLLSEGEQRLFARLSVFAGGWTLEAAEAVGAGPEREEVLELLSRLLDKSLVVAERAAEQPVRYKLVEPVRQYAAEKLEACGEADVARQQHAAWFLALAEQAAPQLRTAEQLGWLDQLEQEHDNLRAALGWALERGEAELALRLVSALGWFWFLRGYFTEWDRWLEAALALCPPDHAETLTALRAKVLLERGMMALHEVRFSQAAELGERSLALYRRVGDRWGIAAALVLLSGPDVSRARLIKVKLARLEESLALAREMDDPWLTSWVLYWLALVRSVELMEESLALARQVGDRWLIGWTLIALGFLKCPHDYRRAVELFEESVAVCGELGNQLGMDWAVAGLADVAFARGDYPAASGFQERRLALEQALGNRHGIADALGDLAMVAQEQGEHERARTLAEQALALTRELSREFGDSSRSAGALRHLGWIVLDQGNHERATALFEESLTLERELDSTPGMASSLGALGWAMLSQGEHEQALAYFTESVALGHALDKQDWWRAARSWEGQDRWMVARSLEGLAAVAGVHGQAAQAARVFGAAEALREASGPARPSERALYTPWLSTVRAALGEAAFAAAWAEGRAMPLEQVIAYALDAGDEDAVQPSITPQK